MDKHWKSQELWCPNVKNNYNIPTCVAESQVGLYMHTI